MEAAVRGLVCLCAAVEAVVRDPACPCGTVACVDVRVRGGWTKLREGGGGAGHSIGFTFSRTGVSPAGFSSFFGVAGGVGAAAGSCAGAGADGGGAGVFAGSAGALSCCLLPPNRLAKNPRFLGAGLYTVPGLAGVWEGVDPWIP